MLFPILATWEQQKQTLTWHILSDEFTGKSIVKVMQHAATVLQVMMFSFRDIWRLMIVLLCYTERCLYYLASFLYAGGWQMPVKHLI